MPLHQWNVNVMANLIMSNQAHDGMTNGINPNQTSIDPNQTHDRIVNYISPNLTHDGVVNIINPNQTHDGNSWNGK